MTLVGTRFHLSVTIKSFLDLFLEVDVYNQQSFR